MQRLYIGCLAGWLVLGAAAPGTAQGLADVAKRAEETRRTSPAPSRTYTVTAPSPVLLTALDKPVLEHYVAFRIALAHTWGKDRGLFNRLYEGMVNARTFEEQCRVLDQEPEIVALLKAHGYSSYSFLSVLASIQIAQNLSGGGYDPTSLTPIQRANLDFVARFNPWIDARRGQILRAEAGLTIWP